MALITDRTALAQPDGAEPHPSAAGTPFVLFATINAREHGLPTSIALAVALAAGQTAIFGPINSLTEASAALMAFRTSIWDILGFPGDHEGGRDDLVRNSCWSALA